MDVIPEAVQKDINLIVVLFKRRMFYYPIHTMYMPKFSTFEWYANFRSSFFTRQTNDWELFLMRENPSFRRATKCVGSFMYSARELKQLATRFKCLYPGLFGQGYLWHTCGVAVTSRLRLSLRKKRRNAKEMVGDFVDTTQLITFLPIVLKSSRSTWSTAGSTNHLKNLLPLFTSIASLARVSG